MTAKIIKLKLKEIFKITGIPVLVASLCCLAPIIVVIFGLGTLTFAASLANTFYGRFRWAFRAAGLVLLGLSIFFYLRRERGICTIDEAKKRRNEIVNTVIFALAAGIVGYIVWLYVVVEYFGKWLNIWK